ncbi:hypothetical protein ACFL0Y_04450, partial [Patescibacteria group bacterium]
MKKWQKVLTSFLFSALILATAKSVCASEGIIELRSNSQNARCFSASVFMADKKFHLLTTCRNLIYPPDPLAMNYVLWATPTNGKEYIRLSVLGTGKS